jgi:hypothetical protein
MAPMDTVLQLNSMILVAILLAVALMGVLLTMLFGAAAGPYDVVSIIGAVICVVGALAIAVEVLWVRDDQPIEETGQVPRPVRRREHP